MEKRKIFELADLVKPDIIDSISGRSYGEDYSQKIRLNSLFEEGYVIEFHINDKLVKAINDSFIKGLFSDLFKKYKSVSKIKAQISIISNEYFIQLFEKNWVILQAISNV